MRLVPLTALLMLAGCLASNEPGNRQGQDDTAAGSTDGSDGSTSADSSVRLSGVEWVVDWDVDGLTQTDGAAWRIDRADGAQLELVTGWVVVYVLVLEPCEAAATRRDVAPPHGLPDHASAIIDSIALPLHTPKRVELGDRSFDDGIFCDVGLALFRADGATANLPDDPDLQNVTLFLEGRIRAAPDQPWTPLAIASGLPAEADLSLTGPTPADPAIATVTLRPAHLLDDVALDDHPDRVALDMLTNLVTTATASLSPVY